MKTLAAAVALTALFATAPRDARAEISIKKITLHKDNGTGERGEEVKTFRPSDHRIFVHVELTGLQVGKTQVHWVFIGAHTSAGDKVSITEASMTALIANEIDGSVKLDHDWPVGSYRAVLFVNGQMLKAIDYIITPLPADLAMSPIVLLRDDGKGKQLEVKRFEKGDLVMNFAARSKGLPLGATFRWSYTALDTTAGKNIAIASANMKVDDPAETTLTGNLSHDSGVWPHGTYRVELFMGDKRIQSADFLVE